MPEPSQAAPPNSSGVSTDLRPLKNLKHDVPASLVVFLVALPLCLGIALASGAPLFAGLIAGIVGGLVVAWLSGSPLAVSGPAAGLTVIVLHAIEELGSWEAFVLAVVIAGVMQIVFGVVRAGIISYYFPSTVIKGLLAAIGVILILKQIPHAVGFDKDPEGEMDFFQQDGHNTFTEIAYAFEQMHMGATIIALVGVAILILLTKMPGLIKSKWLPGPLLVVAMGIGLNEMFGLVAPELHTTGELLVEIPIVHEVGLAEVIKFPDFSRVFDPDVYHVAFTLAIVASIETLLCIEAIDKLDPYKRRSDANKELRAQGIGNIASGLLGGLPITAVIVRGSANIQSGGRTAMSGFLHGGLLLISVVTVPLLLNRIPLAALAAVLLHIGYKLAPVPLFVKMWHRGWSEFAPFIVTIVAILFTNLLQGVMIGMATGIFFILRANLKTPYYMHKYEAYEEERPEGTRTHIHIELSENVSFLNKASVSAALDALPDGSIVEIDGTHALHINRDVLEVIYEFKSSARYRGIECQLKDIPGVDATAAELSARKPVMESVTNKDGPRPMRARDLKVADPDSTAPE